MQQNFTYKFKNNEELKEHFIKHGRETNCKTPKKYLKTANKIIKSKKSLKKLIKAHETRLKNIQKADLKDLCNPTDYLVNYLRYTRDFLIMVGWDTISERHEMSMLALVTAIEEYEKWESCNAEFLTVENIVELHKKMSREV